MCAERRQIASSDNLSDARRHVRRLVRESGSTFYWPMRLLPREKREALFAVYAFCRHVDDAADESSGDTELPTPSFWRMELDRLYAGQDPDHPVSIALKAAIRQYDLPREHFVAILDGCDMDIREEMISPAWATLETYCYRVASAVGLLTIEILGYKNPLSRNFAVTLGKAIQLTNILRDVSEDAQRHRLYLPREWLQEAGLALNEPEEIVHSPALSLVCGRLAQDAARRFHEAGQLLPREDSRQLRMAVLMGAFYQEYLRQMQAAQWQWGVQRPHMSLRRTCGLIVGQFRI